MARRLPLSNAILFTAVIPASTMALEAAMVIEPEPGFSEPRSRISLYGAPLLTALNRPALSVETVASSSPAIRAGMASAPSAKYFSSTSRFTFSNKPIACATKIGPEEISGTTPMRILVRGSWARAWPNEIAAATPVAALATIRRRRVNDVDMLPPVNAAMPPIAANTRTGARKRATGMPPQHVRARALLRTFNLLDQMMNAREIVISTLTPGPRREEDVLRKPPTQADCAQ